MTKRWSLAPIVILPVAALALTACHPDEYPAPADATYATPAVKSGAPVDTNDLVTSMEPEAQAHSGVTPSAAGGTITAPLTNASGQNAGTVTLTEKDGVVVVGVQVRGLTPGFHGVHLHSVGVCDRNSVAPGGGEPGAFLSAGSHLQLGGHTGHPATGDLVSVFVGDGGSGQTVTNTDAFTLDQLKNHDGGVALVVHAGPDNFANIPADRYSSNPPGGPVPDEKTMSTGDAGARAACAVVAKDS